MNKLSDETARELAIRILTGFRYEPKSIAFYCSPPDCDSEIKILDLRGWGMLRSPNGYGLSDVNAFTVMDNIGVIISQAIKKDKVELDGDTHGED